MDRGLAPTVGTDTSDSELAEERWVVVGLGLSDDGNMTHIVGPQTSSIRPREKRFSVRSGRQPSLYMASWSPVRAACSRASYSSRSMPVTGWRRIMASTDGRDPDEVMDERVLAEPGARLCAEVNEPCGARMSSLFRMRGPLEDLRDDVEGGEGRGI